MRHIRPDVSTVCVGLAARYKIRLCISLSLSLTLKACIDLVWHVLNAVLWILWLFFSTKMVRLSCFALHWNRIIGVWNDICCSWWLENKKKWFLLWYAKRSSKKLLFHMRVMQLHTLQVNEIKLIYEKGDEHPLFAPPRPPRPPQKEKLTLVRIYLMFKFFSENTARVQKHSSQWE